MGYMKLAQLHYSFINFFKEENYFVQQGCIEFDLYKLRITSKLAVLIKKVSIAKY